MTVSSIMPPSGLSRTERVDVYAGKDESEDGVRRSRNAVAVGPRKLSCQLQRVRGDVTENERGLNHVSDVENPCLVSNMMMTGN